MREVVRETLGPAYEVFNNHFTRGSISITMVLGVVGAIYFTVSQYDDFIKGRQTREAHRETEIPRAVILLFQRDNPEGPAVI
jgi:hypothetical protein